MKQNWKKMKQKNENMKQT